MELSAFYHISLILALASGLYRLAWTAGMSLEPTRVDQHDTCDATLSRSVYAGHQYAATSCAIHPYTQTETLACLANSTWLFQGDSMARNLFFAARILLGYSSPKEYALEKFRDSQFDLVTPNGLALQFAWDPFLNQSNISYNFMTKKNHVIISSGLWQIRHLGSFGYSNFTSAVETLKARFEKLDPKTRPYFRIISPVEESLLDQDRRRTLNNSIINRYNRHLRDVSILAPLAQIPFAPESLNAVYEEATQETLDGLHYKYDIVKKELDVFLNAICNPILFNHSKGKTSCCTTGPRPTLRNIVFIAVWLSLSFTVYILRWIYGIFKRLRV